VLSAALHPVILNGTKCSEGSENNEYNKRTNVMKRIIYMLAVSAVVLLTAVQANAQMGKRYYINGGWQFNGTISNNVAESAQGYGAYMESGYYLTPMLAVGGFASFSSNDQYYGTQTYTFEDHSALTTDVTKSVYQVPFGATLRCRFMRTQLQPYLAAKIGAEYSEQNTYMSTFVSRSDNWGFYVSPEIGLSWFPFSQTDFGFQLAAYYSYATNQNKSYGMNGINNLGFKLGVAF
jgi:uncharacterized membrane protein